MACQGNECNTNDLFKLIAEEGMDGMAQAMQLWLNEAMKLERERHLQVTPYERSVNRQGYANGFKRKTLKTRVGELALSIPQVREGNFYPSSIERGIRSERALKVALAEMYVQGVSTRKVKAITEALCGFEISSQEVSRASKALDETLSTWRERSLGKYCYLYLDARYEKVRQADGCVRDSAILIAYGIDENGKRRILGISISLSEQEVHWRCFLERLISRGLHGIELIISDAHSGLKAAKQAVFPSVPWQRCQFHLQQNAQGYVPKQSMKKKVAADIRAVFNAVNRVEAERLLKQLCNDYRESAKALSDWMENNLPEGLTVMAFPLSHQRRLRTSNLAERVNEEIRRRTRVVRVFPNVASVERLVTAIVMELDEEWATGKTYLTM